MVVQLDELEIAFRRIAERLREQGLTEFAIDRDYYWWIVREQVHDVDRKPTEFTIGQISDDLNEIRRIARGEREPLAYALVWLSSILRAVGEDVVG